ncbi:hypothetical protein [Furfurilactobacillus rossiae]|uniref:hypothetical protein n=1 Tax=Furfurilactobacillus rossiae TaxID=231049 RepID=UPI00030775CB|nr:hypothetical protein [Furfurilactobacillus rossiae]QFR66908.1 hypothetical protein LR814_07255 [Furfurilactobacillus rossiae]QLE62404.1 hypothetical protein LROSRS0_2359 [Furfurilactobacillus rossiae]
MENRELGVFKVRQSGHSLVVTVPKGINVHKGDQVSFSQGSDGVIQFKPLSNENPWLNGKYADVDFRGGMKEAEINIGMERRVGKEL